jgi:hypothetical protein
LTGTLHWRNGTLLGELTVATNGLLELGFQSGAGTLTGVLTNHGRIQWTAGTYAAWVLSDGRFDNAADGLFDLQLDGQFHMQPGTSAQVNNAGVLRKTGGMGEGFFGSNVRLTNTGLVDVQSGTLKFLDGFTSSSTFSVSNGAALDLNSGTFHLQPGHQVVGAGSYGVLGGSPIIDGPITEPNFLLVGGQLTISNQLTGTLHWRNGTLLGELTVATNGLLELAFQSGAGTLTGVLTNHGHIQWTAGAYPAWNLWDGRFENAPEGLFDLQLDGQFYMQPGTSAQVNNAGVLRKTGGTGTGFFGANVGFGNRGLVDVQSGTMQVPGNSLLAGTWLNLGLASATHFGRIDLKGGVLLTGTLSANLLGGYTPSPGTQFQIITSSGLGGGFNAFALPTHFYVTDNALDIFLTLGDGGPATLRSPTLTGTNFTFVFQSEAGLNYTVERNDDLSTTNWNPVTPISGDGTLKSFLAPYTCIPHRFFRLMSGN